MEYIIAGLLLSVGWHVVKIVYEMVCDILFTRLHKAKWYLTAAGKTPKTMKEQPGDIKAVKNKIGFY